MRPRPRAGHRRTLWRPLTPEQQFFGSNSCPISVFGWTAPAVNGRYFPGGAKWPRLGTLRRA